MASKKRSRKYIDNKDVRELVKARLSTLPGNVNISIGSEGSFSKEDLIEHIDKKDKLGSKFVEMDIKFLQALKEGIFYEQDCLNNKT